MLDDPGSQRSARRGGVAQSRVAAADRGRDPSDLIARRLRHEREARRWSLADLARRSKVSKAMISKIERGEASPSAATLVRLASAFELTLATLIARAEGAAGRLVRAGEQPRWRDPASRYLRRQVFARAESPLELVEVQLPPGARVVMPAESYTFIRQLVWVRKGKLTLTEGDERHELGPEDCLALGEPAKTTFQNRGRARCTYVVALARR